MNELHVRKTSNLGDQNAVHYRLHCVSHNSFEVLTPSTSEDDCFKEKALKEMIKLKIKLLRCTLIESDWCLSKEREF